MNQYTKKQLADAVRTARSQKGYTQQELSDRTGLSLRSIQRIEKEEVLPRAYTVRILATHLGIPESETAAATESIEGPTIIDQTLTLPISSNAPPLNKPRKIILTIGIGMILFMAALAFIAQSPRFPETLFEALLFWIAISTTYMLILYNLWR